MLHPDGAEPGARSPAPGPPLLRPPLPRGSARGDRGRLGKVLFNNPIMYNQESRLSDDSRRTSSASMMDSRIRASRMRLVWFGSPIIFLGS